MVQLFGIGSAIGLVAPPSYVPDHHFQAIISPAKLPECMRVQGRNEGDKGGTISQAPNHCGWRRE